MKKTILLLLVLFLTPYLSFSKVPNQENQITKERNLLIYKERADSNPYLRKLKTYADKDPYNINRAPAQTDKEIENEIYYHWDLGLGM